MKTVSGSEFIAHPEKYLDMAIDQEVRIKNEQLILHPDEDLHNVITAEELKRRMRVSIHDFFIYFCKTNK